jgi:hypothetical protein
MLKFSGRLKILTFLDVLSAESRYILYNCQVARFHPLDIAVMRPQTQLTESRFRSLEPTVRESILANLKKFNNLRFKA